MAKIRRLELIMKDNKKLVFTAQDNISYAFFDESENLKIKIPVVNLIVQDDDYSYNIYSTKEYQSLLEKYDKVSNKLRHIKNILCYKS